MKHELEKLHFVNDDNYHNCRRSHAEVKESLNRAMRYMDVDQPAYKVLEEAQALLDQVEFVD